MIRDIIRTYRAVTSNYSGTVEAPITIAGIGDLIIADEFVGGVTGVWNKPAAATTNGKIYVNSALLKQPVGIIRGAIEHEKAHIVLNHVQRLRDAKMSMTAYQRQVAFAYGLGFQIECEADCLAFKNGGDIMGFLETQGNTYNVRKRIKILKLVMEQK